MMFSLVQRAVLITVAACACYGLAEWLGPITAALSWAFITAGACTLGVALLWTSTIGRVAWRNRAAGYLIPWGWRLNKGRLPPVALISWAVWMAVGAAVLVLRSDSTAEHSAVGLRIALFVAWIADVAALLFVWGSIRQATPGSRVGVLWKLTAVIALILAVSVSLYVSGRATTALVVGGGPVAVVCGGAGLLLLFFVTIGRNARWN